MLTDQKSFLTGHYLELVMKLWLLIFREENVDVI